MDTLSASDRVYRHAKSEILSRHYAPQHVLTEGELADAVGVSRTPVREALLRLQAEGLVQLLPKRGALILPVTAAEVADVLETRRLVEGHAVDRAVADGSTALVERLAGHVATMRTALERDDAATYVEADRDFHADLVAATGNAILIDLYGALRDRQLRMGATNLLDDAHGIDPERARGMIADHEAILAGVRDRDDAAARAAVTAHLDRAEHTLARRGGGS